MTFEFSNEALEALRAAGYTKVTFTMSAEAESLGRIVCRWAKGVVGAADFWIGSPNKNDLSPATNGATKTVTFDLTEATCGAANDRRIALQVQNSSKVPCVGVLTLTDFVFE